MTGTDERTPAEGPEPGGYAAARLRLLTEGARTGPPRRAALAELTDDWLAGLFTAAAGRPQGVSLVAVGGYGRGELSPRSDLDLLLLHDGSDPTAVAALADRLWYPVWDLGLDLDHSVRTLAEARRTAGEDLKVQLGLLDARHVAGDLGLTTALRTAVLADWRNQAPRRLPELKELGDERAARQGELRFLLEPDLKEARGGLRDATALRAVAASWLADAPREGLAEARRHLLDVRDALHLSTGRATDRLALQEQDQVAAELGLLDADVLLRQVYEAARVISYAGDVTWREVGRVLRSRAVRPRLRAMLGGGRQVAERSPLAEGVVEQDGEVVLARAARPERDPVLPLRAAAAAAQAGLPLSPYAVRRMAAGTRPLPTPWPAEAREQLVTLLGSGRPTVEVWEALEAEGLISRLLPDWERVRCRPQRNAVHVWTVDRHLIETAVRASALTRHVHRPDLLLVAALLHDIGKGWPGDHSVAGEIIAKDVAARIGFDPEDAAVLSTLVRHHLLLVDTATRRDLDDPATVRSVAEAVGTQSTLELLHALTEADALATGPAAWSAWRGSLVGDLVRRVGALLAGEVPDEPAPTAPTAEQERLAIEAFRTGGPVLALRARSEPVPAEEPPGAPEPLGVELLIAVPDQTAVLPAVAGVLAVHRLTVRTAELRTLRLPEDVHDGDGSVLLLDWRVAAEYGSLPEAARLRADLVRALDGSLDIAGRLAERDAAYPRRRGLLAPPPRVTVAPAASHHATVIEVRAQDAPGLLHRIGMALEKAGVRVRSMHVSTLGANAVDAFYVTTGAGEPLPAGDAGSVARALEETLRAP
ncbi:bifunctional uridylyltransferase/uridylyl-removing enzyme [Streptomyces hygroscopicus subsp. hygroscopicus]|uniref:[protein-PII] uridylyltransferase n=1 Tax=Streptomyces sp. KHY 26 TaxID=3097359 RepID=UPI0024A46EBD|nr:[protein-PII] uridylyltransferase [Streptomyces hygroscopicus]GLX51924.1 bifunctional uridylyltransferase/uridylyl-removing enzyme [Streptomyces hygroscopicus subsp. hygroscopicus]